MKIMHPILAAGFAAAIIASPALAQSFGNNMDHTTANALRPGGPNFSPDKNQQVARDKYGNTVKCDPAAEWRMGPNNPSDPPASGYAKYCSRS